MFFVAELGNLPSQIGVFLIIRSNRETRMQGKNKKSVEKAGYGKTANGEYALFISFKVYWILLRMT